MKVNMTPNPLDVVTIHASQGDTEARQWEFELHNNGELIDTSEVTEQMFFKAYKGGTEQLLPENGSTPTTSPFKGDIKYPQGLLTDQEFTYRQSPTEEDGLAKITDIKGNTLVWNQLINATDGSGTIGEGVAYTTSNGVITLNGTPTSDSSLVIGGAFSAKANHKYLLKGCPSGGGDTTYQLFVSRSSVAFPQGNRLQDTGNGKIATALGDENNLELRLYVYSSSPTFSNTKFIPQIFDLTAMGLDSLTNAEILQWFANYFPLSYYSYNQGSLLSFNGNGIKTVSKNQFNTQTVSPSTTVGTTLTKGDGSIRLQYTGAGRYTGFNFMNPNGGFASDWANKLLLKKKYRLSFDFGGAEVTWICGLRTASGNSFVGSITMRNQGHYSLTLDLDTMTEDVYISWARTGNSTNPFDVTVSNIQLELGTTETPYTPFEEKTISLPISQYFPTGMKSAGNAYDELTDSKAIARIGAVDLGTLTYTIDAGNTLYAPVTGLKGVGQSEMPNILCALFTSIKYSDRGSVSYPNISITSDLNIRFGNTGYTDANAFKTAMIGVYLYYELATPTETSFTTASLVTENAEIPLSNNDGVLVGKCTEQLSENPGFIDAKIKLTDSDGTCYSNKLQLHVERSPQ